MSRSRFIGEKAAVLRADLADRRVRCVISESGLKAGDRIAYVWIPGIDVHERCADLLTVEWVAESDGLLPGYRLYGVAPAIKAIVKWRKP